MIRSIMPLVSRNGSIPSAFTLFAWTWDSLLFTCISPWSLPAFMLISELTAENSLSRIYLDTSFFFTSLGWFFNCSHFILQSLLALLSTQNFYKCKPEKETHLTMYSKSELLWHSLKNTEKILTYLSTVTPSTGCCRIKWDKPAKSLP